MTDQKVPSDPRPPAVDWYYEHDGVVLGPVTEEGLREAARAGQIKTDTLVWQDALDHWEDATNITGIAEILGCTGMVLKIEPSAVRMRVEPRNESPALEESVDASADEPGSQQALDDAVSDEEAADPVIDVQQVRAILERASIPPPRRPSIHPTEYSIPPASAASNPPPAPTPKKGLFGLARVLVGVAVTLVVSGGIGVVMTTPSQHDRGRASTPKPAAPTAGVAAARLSAESSPVTSSASAWFADASVDRASPNESATTAAERATFDIDRDPAKLCPVTQVRPATAPLSATTAVHVPSTTDATNGAVAAAAPLVTVEGPLDAALFSQRLQRSLRVFEDQCWTSLLVRVPNYEKNPAVDIELSVDRTGHVYDVRSGAAPRGYFGVGRCIGGRMRGWKFPAMDVGTRATLTVKRLRH